MSECLKIFMHFIFLLERSFLLFFGFHLVRCVEILSKSDDKVSPTKWKSMDEESLTGNKSLAIHLQNLDKITVLAADASNIDSIDEETVYSQNLHNDDDDHLYGVV